MVLNVDQSSELEETACPLCGASEASPSPYAQQPFVVVRCRICRLWYLNPRLRADVTRAYYESDGYFSGGEIGYGDYGSQEESLRAGFRALLDRLRRLGVTGGRLLEIGSGFGYFLDEARGRFDERIGVELSPAAAQAAAARTGATILASIEQLREMEPFDLVFASHVIEHIYDPVPFSRNLIAQLRPGGAIVYSTPDMNSLWRKLMRSAWPSFKYPEHVSFFDAETLARLLEKAGAVSTQRIRILDRFPLSTVLSRLGLPTLRLAADVSVPIPAVSVCMIGQRPAADR